MLAWLALAAPACLGQGWSTNWPAWEHQRELTDQVAQTYSGTLERCTVTGVAAPSAPTWYRSNRGDIVNLKTKVKALIPYFADTNRSDNGTDFEQYFLDNAGSWAVNIPKYSVTGLCAMVGVPINYFEYTPYRGLSGAGGSTEDATVGHPHGWTNSTTLAGGTYYPGGRTNWYTTDYGVDGLRAVLDALRWTTIARGSANETSITNAIGYTRNWTSWAAAKAGAEASYPGASSSGYYLIGNYAARMVSAKDWTAYILMRTWRMKVTGLATNYAHEVQFYCYSELEYTYSPPVYTNWGINLLQDTFTLLDAVGPVYDGSVTGAVVGSVTLPGTWCNEPAAPDSYAKYSSLGVSRTREADQALVKWDGANGFQYK